MKRDTTLDKMLAAFFDAMFLLNLTAPEEIDELDHALLTVILKLWEKTQQYRDEQSKSSKLVN